MCKLWVRLLDCFIVTTSIWDVFVDVLTAILPPDQNGFESVSGLSTLKAFRVIRVTRVLKIAQLLRIFRFVMALRTLVQSIFHTLKALVWALLLLALIVCLGQKCVTFLVMWNPTRHKRLTFFGLGYSALILNWYVKAWQAWILHTVLLQ